MDGETLKVGRARVEETAMLVDRLDKARGRGQAIGDCRGVNQQLYASTQRRRIPNASGYIGGQVARRRLPRSKTGPSGQPRLDSVDAECPPILSTGIPGNEVPAAASIDQPMWLARA